MVALGVLGVALGVYRLVRRGTGCSSRRSGMFLSAALLYLSVLGIGPGPDVGDGRHLQVVSPGFLLAAVVVLAVVGQRGRAGRVAAAVLAASMFVVPLFVSHRLVWVRDGVPQGARAAAVRAWRRARTWSARTPPRPADGHRSAGWPCRAGTRR